MFCDNTFIHAPRRFRISTLPVGYFPITAHCNWPCQLLSNSSTSGYQKVACMRRWPLLIAFTQDAWSSEDPLAKEISVLFILLPKSWKWYIGYTLIQRNIESLWKKHWILKQRNIGSQEAFRKVVRETRMKANGSVIVKSFVFPWTYVKALLGEKTS